MRAGDYDYIIAGMGCAGLSLAVRMSAAGLTKGKKLLLIDNQKKDKNDRTWCFWEDGIGPFESIVFKSWQQAWFYSNTHTALLQLSPFAYKMIRGIDFFNYCMYSISKDPAIEILYASVESVGNDDNRAYCVAAGNTYQANFLFNSILFDKPALVKGEHFLLQHFKGWVIQTDEQHFDPGKATLMDFRPSQEYGTTFVYVMPFSSTEALIEYTLFSPGLLQEQEYRQGLTDYVVKVLKIKKWRIKEEEFGVIPMTDYKFERRQGAILNIGTAGGRTKASSGYTFHFIQKDTAEIISALSETGSPFAPNYKYSRFQWYDSVLLNILSNKVLAGDRVFTDLFKNNSIEKILKFLDNETTVSEELRIISSLPQLPFLKAGFSEIAKKINF